MTKVRIRLLAIVLVLGAASMGCSGLDETFFHDPTPTNCLLKPRSQVLRNEGLLVPDRMPAPISACNAGVFMTYAGRGEADNSEIRWESGYNATPVEDAPDGSVFVQLYQRDAYLGPFPKSFCAPTIVRFERVVGDQRIFFCFHDELTPKMRQFWQDVKFTDRLSKVAWITESPR